MKALPLALLAALLLVPAASATRSHHVRLAVVPLPKSVIGAAATSFSVAYDSGRVSNADAAAHTPDATTKTFKKLGRLDGYALEYGNAFTGAAGVTDVRTAVDRYRTAADATRALAFWKKEDAALSRLDNPSFSVTSVPVQLPRPAAKTSHFAYLTSYSASNIVPVSGSTSRSPTARTSSTSSSRPGPRRPRRRSRRSSRRRSWPASGSSARGGCTRGR